MVAVGAIAYELHQVGVVQPAQQIHLRGPSQNANKEMNFQINERQPH
jgi:hypothetical protein